MKKWFQVKEVSRVLGEHYSTLWPILHHYVDEAKAIQTWKEVKRIAIDETSRVKGIKTCLTLWWNC